MMPRKKSQKFWEKSWFQILSLTSVISAIGAILFLPVFSDGCNIYNKYIIKTCFIKEIGPKLELRDINFIYYDKNYNQINKLGNFSDVPEVNLNEISKIGFEALITNTGDTDLVINYENRKLYLFNKNIYNQIVEPSVEPFESEGDVILTKNSSLKFGFGFGIVASKFLEILRGTEETPYLIFDPTISYYQQGNPSDVKYLDTIFKCRNLFIKTELPRFKKNCYPTIKSD